MYITLAQDVMSVIPRDNTREAQTAYGHAFVHAERHVVSPRAFAYDTLSVSGEQKVAAGDCLVIDPQMHAHTTATTHIALVPDVNQPTKVTASMYLLSSKDVGIRLEDEDAFKYLEARQTFFWG